MEENRMKRQRYYSIDTPEEFERKWDATVGKKEEKRTKGHLKKALVYGCLVTLVSLAAGLTRINYTNKIEDMEKKIQRYEMSTKVDTIVNPSGQKYLIKYDGKGNPITSKME